MHCEHMKSRSLVRLKAGACATPDKPVRDLPPPLPNKPEENPFDRPLDDPDKRPPGIPPGIPIPDLPTPPPTARQDTAMSRRSL